MKSKRIKNNKKANITETKLRELVFLDIDDLYHLLDSNSSGLNRSTARKRLEEYGTNIITVDKTNTTFTRLRDAVINPFNIVLIIVAFITFLTDIVFSDSSDYLTVTIILFLVSVSSLIAFIQGEKSNKTAEKLSSSITNKADVLRNDNIIEIDIKNIVIGDIVKLSAGDMIPADVRFITTKDAFIAQAALTGESDPVEKFSSIQSDSNVALTDISNIGFMGTNMISGSASAIVIATGNDTYFGSMAKTLSGSRAKNSFERGIDSVSSLLIRFMLIMLPIILIINGITKNDWLSSLLFAVSIAVGLTPEMLPVIMTSTLAKGALNMAKHNVIVKDLGSIQAFGEMDILCTDKTGTLTEDKIILEKYMNIRGEDDTRILRHAFLNSYFQTSLKNLIDIAIINRANESGLNEIINNYTRIDELPFDFSRRRMSVFLKDNNKKRQLITKGAVEEIISVCKYIELDGEVVTLNAAHKKIAMETYNKHNSEGLRILAIAQKNDDSDTDIVSIKDENDMILIGFVGFLDPPKKSAESAITALKNHGIRVVVLTGDSEGVATKVCDRVGVNTEYILTGLDVEKMTNKELSVAVKKCDLFCKISPSEKEKVVIALQNNGHTVGYMGDGINDALPLRQADVGISVDSAVDIAKETANIILLKKDLMVLEEGVIHGRITFGNIIKYIKMAASGNFGNMISVIVASIFLPFLPMLPIHILIQNLLCDFSQMGIPFDKVDKEYIKKPRKWNAKSIKTFMFYFGPVSSIFDILCFTVMFYIIKANTMELAPLFQCGWFIFGTLSQIVVIYTIRTAKLPFVESKPSLPLLISTIIVIIITCIISFTNVSLVLNMAKLPLIFIPWLLCVLLSYCLATQLFKDIYISKYREWF